MNCDLYKAAIDGITEVFQDKTEHDLRLLVTPINNTILHIHITSPSEKQKSTDFLKEILKRCPSLLWQPNKKGDTPLHAAAKCGNPEIVKVLIEQAKCQPKDSQAEEIERGEGSADADPKQRMLRKKNNEGNTALHEAVQNYYTDVVQILTEEDPGFPYDANIDGQTPLFIAAQRGSFNMVDLILHSCESARHEGPDGKTALHAAVMGMKKEAVEIILKNKYKRSLTKETDQNEWTPLHYAAYYGEGRSSIAKLLLEYDESAAYMLDRDRKMTPLHMAASQGYDDIMEAIISRCPDCCEIVDSRGWNVLHFAMTGLSANALMKFLLRDTKYKTLMKDLLYGEDIRGNTPLHVLAGYRPETFTGLSSIPVVKNHLVFNKQNDSVSHIMNYGSPQLEQEMLELSKIDHDGPYRHGVISCRNKGRLENEFYARVEKAKDAQLVVAALIATVTFAAAFTMPGGYNSEDGPNQGTTILTRNVAFQTFIITDASAMTFSLFAVYLHFIGSLNTYDYRYLYRSCFVLTILAMVAMVVAFATGTYAVLAPSPGLAIAICLIGLSFFVLVVWMTFKKDMKEMDAKT